VISDRMAEILALLHRRDRSHTAVASAAALGVDSIAASLAVSGSASELVWCSGDLSVRFEDAQFTLGEGPGPDALRSGELVAAPDLARIRPDRWPVLAQTLEGLPVRAVFCLPLGLGAIRVGVLTALRRSSGPMSEQQATDALALSAVLTALFLGGDGRLLDSWAPAESPRVLQRAVVHQATGMISVQLDVPLPEALLRLRASAYSSGRPINDVAHDVVARRLRFHVDMNGPNPPGNPRG
jgi:hypothetical protein